MVGLCSVGPEGIIYRWAGGRVLGSRAGEEKTGDWLRDSEQPGQERAQVSAQGQGAPGDGGTGTWSLMDPQCPLWGLAPRTRSLAKRLRPGAFRSQRGRGRAQLGQRGTLQLGSLPGLGFRE